MSNIAIKSLDSKAKVMAFLQHELATEGDTKNSFIETLLTGTIGLVGAGAGAAIGKPSLLLGLGTIFVGHYCKSKKVIALGTGMLTTGTFKAIKGIDGTEVAGFDGAKERFKAFGQDLKERLYLDKIKNLISKKKSENNNGTEGLGEVKYFNPNNAEDMAGLNNIEQEVQRQAERFERKQFAGTDELDDTEDRIIY